MLDSLLEPAFADPVAATQQTIRVALNALSEPGVIQTLDDVPALGSLAPAMYALCLTLLDNDTPVWLSPAFDTPAMRANLAFHCACPVVAAREDAKFALLMAAELDELQAFDAGTDRDPDQSCTLLIQVTGFDQGPLVTCKGPGIEHERSLRLPLDAGFWQQRKRCNAFPRGLDMFFGAGRQLMGLPRSTRVSLTVEGVL